MSLQRLRRVLLVAACASSALLAACGGGNSVVEQFNPTRFVAFGDAMSDLGQGGSRYTINDGSTNIWTQRLAERYGHVLTTAVAGGTSYAVGNARVVTKPDAAGNAATPTVADQISTFLASNTLSAQDMVILQGGLSDVVAEAAAVVAGTRTSAQAVANIEQAGRDLATQARRLTAAGATHVILVGPYNIGRSPWAVQTGQATLMTDLVTRFNNQLLIALVDAGDKMLYVDAALYFNLVTGTPATFGFKDVSSIACTSVDAGAGIGTGVGEINSKLCTPSTIASGIDSATTVWADRVHFTPGPHVGFADWAWQRIRIRW